jgi:hypothetical protein
MSALQSNVMKFGSSMLAFSAERHKFRYCSTYAVRLESNQRGKRGVERNETYVRKIH